MPANSLGWDPNCDVSGSTVGLPDGIIDADDVYLAVLYFGRYCT
jgi:hypothetical protein